jgi:H+/Cl- antiporter ClcA
VSKPNEELTLRQMSGLWARLLRWVPIAAVVGVLAGTASSVLLWSLNEATAVRESHVWLIALLAPAGFGVGLLYHWLGKRVESGNNLILEEIHDPKETIPLRMTPLILLGTYLTHLFGGSAGREGTAIQTGASLADQLAKPLRMSGRERRILLMAGVSAGFGSVFGIPLAGGVFGMEVLAVGGLSYEAILPCFLASFAGDLMTRWWEPVLGFRHSVYPVDFVPAMSVTGLLAAMAAGVVFGLVGMGFARATHEASGLAKRWIAFAPLRPAAGGVLVSLGVWATHSTRYIGLGVPTIVAAFTEKLPWYDWAGKFAFTVVTLGAGFKGGEVTPLFFVGATLGNSLSHWLPLPMGLLAGMGLAAVFGSAANTPIAATLMAAELFGAEAAAYAGIACVVSYLCSGHAGIYRAQRVQRHKLDAAISDK